MITQMQPRPPWVSFEDRSEEDRNATIEKGRLVMKSVNYVVLRQAGSKDTVEKEADSWLIDCDRQAERGNFPRDWAEAFRKKYEAWKLGREAPPNGFPLKDWASLTKARAENYATIGIFTVEDLAVLSEDAMLKVGIGGRADKDKAQAWLDSRLTHGNTEQLAALRAETADKDVRIKQLEDMLQSMSDRLEVLESTDRPGKRKAS